MRIAIVTAFPENADRPGGGVEAVSVNLVRGLSELPGLDLHIVTTDRSCKESSVSSWHGATIHRLAWVGGKVLSNALGPGRRQVRNYLAHLKPDVIHSHDVFGLMVTSLPSPRVFTQHGAIHVDTRINGGRFSFLRSLVWRWFETSGWADQPHIVAISPYVRDSLQHCDRSVIHVIDNPIAPEFFDIRREEKPGVIFSAADFTPRKNTLGLLEALALLMDEGLDVQMRLAGRSPDVDYALRVRRFIDSRGLKDRVTVLGRISSEQVREELAQASVMALVSLNEGAPMCISEAMAAGVPVVASDICGVPYMVRDGQSGSLVNPHDAQDIARHLSELIRDQPLRQSMSDVSRRIAQERFAPRRVAMRTRMVYEQAYQEHLSRA